MEKQTVWRTASEAPHSGYFVWEIIQVMGEPTVMLGNMVQCRDGSWILVMPPWHFWGIEPVMETLFERNDPFTDPYIITGMPDLTIQEWKQLFMFGDE